MPEFRNARATAAEPEGIVVLLMGLYLWYWPRVRRWRSLRQVRIGRGAYTFSGDVHRFVGVLATPVLLLILSSVAARRREEQLVNRA